MDLREQTFSGPPVDDTEIFHRLPPELRDLLSEVNGAVLFSGGLHMRGASHEPPWHSIRRVWVGGQALHEAYTDVLPTDVPFGQDALGDQFVLRDGVVHRLSGETGEIKSLGVDLHEFLRAANADPLEYLHLHPLVQFMQDGGRLEPGYLLSVAPPFCMSESGEGVFLRAVPAESQLNWLAELSAQLAGLEPGATVRFKFVD